MIIGIDIGTQSLKAVVCDRELGVLGEASSAYQPVFPRPGWAQQDPRLWEQALAPAIAGALDGAGLRPDDVTALGIAGQLDGCVAVDSAGQPLAPALIWMDRRAVAEMVGVPAEEIRRRAGVVADATHMAAKIRWLQRHGPAGAVRYHQPVSYLVQRLTGVERIDHALASTTMLYSLEARDYDPVLLALFGIDRRLLPPIADAATRAGELNAKGASLTGLPAGIPVAVGTGDDFANPLGAGLAAPGRAVVAIGTAEVVGALDPRPLLDPEALVETHAYIGAQYFIENPGWLSGGAVGWFCGVHRLADPAELDRLAAAVPAGAEGLTFLPALSGAMAPRWVAEARGCYYGLSAAHGTAHMARALLEGCAFAMRDVIDRLRAMGVTIDALLLLGGGAKSGLWAQIRADLTGLPVQIPEITDTSPIGAAVLAAVAAGLQPDVATAASRVGRVARTIEPDQGARSAYDAAYARYRRLFTALEPLFGAQG